MVPPWRSTTCLQMASPSPVPLVSPRLAVPLVVKKGWKILGRSFSGIPGPVSMTWILMPSSQGRGFDGERTTFAEHGLAGVDEKIQENLFDLDGVATDARVGGDLDAQRDAVLLRVAREDGERFVDDFLHVDVAAGGFAAGERQHAGADAGGFFGTRRGIWSAALRTSSMSGLSVFSLFNAYCE